jgi:hypothetical protein
MANMKFRVFWNAGQFSHVEADLGFLDPKGFESSKAA